MREKYNTGQKKMISDFLIENQNKYVSAEEIRAYMDNQGKAVGLTTIYRNLNQMEKEEIVRIEIRNHTKFYQYIPNECSNHFHLKCKKCGKTIHLDCKEFEQVNLHIIEEHKFKLDHNTIIYGTCEQCS